MLVLSSSNAHPKYDVSVLSPSYVSVHSLSNVSVLSPSYVSVLSPSYMSVLSPSYVSVLSPSYAHPKYDVSVLSPSYVFGQIWTTDLHTHTDGCKSVVQICPKILLVENL